MAQRPPENKGGVLNS